ncbi:MAG: PLP-dependent aminotransferase family protein [Clostridiales bacterium]|nr:PLP-dependent aminotransferase family protein [Clostridiales bacterium]
MDFRYAHRLDNLSGNAIRDIFKLLKDPNMISFAGGNPAASALREDFVSELAVKVLKDDGKRILQYGATEGYAPLLESVAEFIKTAGINAPASEVLPVTGSGQGIDLICKAMIDPGDVILVEEPTFLGAMHTMKTYQADIKPLLMDEYGVIPEDLEEKIKKYNPKFAYIIPTFQNPTGRTLPLERRKKIAQIAAKYQTLVLEDDPYRDLRYSGEPLPAIKSFDTEGYVVYMTSFSKTISPGLRVGAVIAPAPLHRKLTICKQGADVHSATLSQAIVDAYLRTGVLPQHMAENIASYSAQMEKMLSMISLFPDGVKCVRPDGGLFIWLDMPEKIDSQALLPIAASKGVAYVSGTYFYPDGGHKNTMRLNFSNSPLDKIEKGMNILASVLDEAMKA